MSDIISEAVDQLNAKSGGSYDGSAKFVIEDEGTIMLDHQGARATDEPAEVTMHADADTFRQILEGNLDPTSAFMSGKLKIEGDMMQAMNLARIL